MARIPRSKQETPPHAANAIKSPRLAFTCLGAGVLLLGGFLYANPTHKQTHAKSAAQSLPAPVKVYGSKSAPVTMEVFTDYQCPTCGQFFEQTLRPMINDYVSAGKVYLVHHDYPLQMHQYSGQAARWANAAAEIGEFSDVEAALYDNQAAWTASGNLEKYVSGAMSTSDFKRMQKIMEGCEAPGPVARPGGMIPSPHPCALDAYIEHDIQLGNQVPVTGTPTYLFIYKGQKYPPGSGFVSWPILRQFIDSLLSQ